MTDAMPNKVWLYGAGGHAHVVEDVLRDLNVAVAGRFDDNRDLIASNRDQILPGIGVDGGGEFKRPDGAMIIAIGNCRVRAGLADKIGGPFFTAIQPDTNVSKSVTIGQGSVVFHRAVVQAMTTIGRHVIVNTGAKIDHESELSDFVHVAPGVTLCGNVRLGTGSFVGAGAVVIPGVRIGRWSVIGAGSVIISDVPDYAVVVGNPGRVIRFDKSQQHLDE